MNARMALSENWLALDSKSIGELFLWKIAITVGTAPLKTHPAVIQRLSDPGSTWHQIFEVWDAPEIVRPGVPELPLLGSPARRSFTMFFMF